MSTPGTPRSRLDDEPEWVGGEIALPRWPAPGDMEWARCWAAGRLIGLRRMQKQRTWRTGALRNLALACVGLYLPMEPALFTDAMVLPGVLSVEIGVALLFILKAGAVSVLALHAVAMVKLGRTEKAHAAGWPAAPPATRCAGHSAARRHR